MFFCLFFFIRYHWKGFDNMRSYKEIEIKDIKNLFKERPLDSHKGMFGTVGIMGGSLEYSGSIKLSSISSEAV